MKRGFDIVESSLIGEIGIVVSDRGLERIILFEEELKTYLAQNPLLKRDQDRCHKVKRQLQEYFLGKRKTFDVTLWTDTTPFRERVWRQLLEIPYGQTISYSELASRIGNPRAIRAVGGANRTNPIPIIIPCHRVIGKNGGMVGYAGSQIDTKIKLIAHENRYIE